MDHAPSVIVFASENRGSSGLLNDVLRELGITRLLPHQISSSPNEISAIVIERPVHFAVTICSNLRKMKELAQVPILVIPDSEVAVEPAKFAPFRADVLPGPVTPSALSGYLSEKVFAKATAPAGPAGQQAQAQPAEPQPARGPAPEGRQAPPAEGAASGEAASQNGGPGPVEQPGHRPERSEKEKAAGKAAAKEASKQVRPPNDFEDNIPALTRPLSRPAAPPHAGKGGVRCGHCRRWLARREDAFCSRCGVAMISLELAPPSVVTFEPLGNHHVGRIIELKNVGGNQLQVAFQLRAGGALENRLSLSVGEGTLEAGGVGELLITLDARGLDLATTNEATLEISTNEKGYTRRELKLLVERLARPKVTPKGRYIYALGEEIENHWEFEVANEGGRTLKLQGVKMDLSKDKGAEVPIELLAPVAVKGGESATARLRLPKVELMQSGYKRKISWAFENRGTITLDLDFQAMRPPKLVVRPEEVNLDVVSTLGSRHIELELRNTGGERLKVEAIDLKAGWLKFQNQVSFPFEILSGSTKVLDLYATGSEELAGPQRAEVTIRSDSFQNPLQVIPVEVEFVVPVDHKEFIGIDFGTTASCIAMLENGQPRLIPIDPDPTRPAANSCVMPSTLYFRQDGKVFAGRVARELARTDPANSVSAMKRVLGSKDKRKLAGQEYDATQQTAMVLRELVARAQTAMFGSGKYEIPRRAVVTVPVEFSDDKRRALLEACRLAELEAYMSSKQGVIIDEALAAAFYYLMRRSQEGAEPSAGAEPERILVFDYGGGTLDCQLIEVCLTEERVTFETLAAGGAPDLGGEDIDWALARVLAEKVKQQCSDFDVRCLEDLKNFDRYYRDEVTWVAAYQTRSIFKDKAEQAKIELCKAQSVNVELSHLLRKTPTRIQPFITDGQHGLLSVEVTLDEDEFGRVLAPFLARAIGVMETVCRRGKSTLADVRTILHAGRTSMIPTVREQINAALPNLADDSKLIEPKVCVALGAAYWGYTLENSDIPFEFIGGANRLLHDIGYIVSGLGKQKFVTVFPAQTTFPCETTINRARVNDTRITLRLAENRGTNPVVDNNPEVIRTGIVNIDVSKETESSIPVKFSIDERRMLVVSVNEQTQTIEIGG